MKRVNAVYCLIYDNETEKVLMVHNKDVNCWSMPGGAVEEGETLEQAAIRELQEETGLIGGIGDVVAINECFFEEKSEHALFITFRTEIIGGNIIISNPDEISKVAWIDVPTADDLMPFHKGGIGKLIQNSSTYCYQGHV